MGKAWICSHCGYNKDNTATWCASGCGSDYSEMSAEERTAYESCYWCKASGVEATMYGIKTCHLCHGNCMIRIRDKKGRFSTKRIADFKEHIK